MTVVKRGSGCWRLARHAQAYRVASSLCLSGTSRFLWLMGYCSEIDTKKGFVECVNVRVLGNTPQ